MNINDIMTDGKIDGGKMYRFFERSVGESYEDFDAFAEAINAHIASLKQETPITPELLKRAGFVVRYNARESLRYYEKGKVSFGFFMRAYVEDILFTVKTMEQLATIWECYTGEPLNWQHDPAAEVRKRLEAMGFKKRCADYYAIFIGNLPAAHELKVLLTDDLESIKLVAFGNASTGIKTIDALERVVKELRGE